LSIKIFLPASDFDYQLFLQEGYIQSNPLVYYFGHTSPSDNVKLYSQLVSALASRINGRLERDVDARASGIIINTRYI
jgi:polyribonucleotide 5'-hydroxyl-kinase